MTEPLSVVVITLNAERHLEACLKSVMFADEIIVVDSGSTDDTPAIAAKHGAKLISQDWLGYGKQKNFATSQARHRWVLSLDADEVVSETLRKEIQSTLHNPRYNAYLMPRRNRFLGHWLKHGEGYPDLSLRLFNREHARWSEDPVHEKVVTREPIGRLQGDLLHESEDGIVDYLSKQNRYTTLQAQVLYAKGKRTGSLRLLFSPFFRFIKFYIFRLGFLDGMPGLLHILIGCNNSFLKYAKLIELEKKAAIPSREPSIGL